MVEILDLNGQGRGVLLDTGTLAGREIESGMIRDDDEFSVQIDLGFFIRLINFPDVELDWILIAMTFPFLGIGEWRWI